LIYIYSILGIVVEDCLNVLLNLVQQNASNQNYFRESSYVRRLGDCFPLNIIGEQRWLEQMNNNMHLLLQVQTNRLSMCQQYL
jgi:hypothetical protein